MLLTLYDISNVFITFFPKQFYLYLEFEKKNITE